MGEWVRIGLRARGLSQRAFLAELARRGLPRVSTSVFNRILGGEQRQVRRSVRSAIAEVLGPAFWQARIGGELPDDMQTAVPDSAAKVDWSLVDDMLSAVELARRVPWTGRPVLVGTPAAHALLADDLAQLISLPFWLRLLYGAAAPEPSDASSRDFAGSVLAALDILADPMRGASSISPDPRAVSALHGWIDAAGQRPRVPADTNPPTSSNVAKRRRHAEIDDANDRPAKALT